MRIRYEYSYQEGGFYMAIAKEQLREIIKENDIQNVGDIYNLLKDSFKDMMQEMLEAEMDVSIGYPKNEKCELIVDNKRNGYTSKTVKSQFGEFVNRAAYVVLGVTLDGEKDILSINIGANETSKFWLGMLNDLKNRGVMDVLFFCVDGLPGFKEAINSVYPKAQIQRCIIHMLRNSFKYISYKDIKKFAADFKSVYKAPNEELALVELELLKDKWGTKYPYAISNWENNWDVVSPFFSFSDDIRRIMYTINIIEGLNRQFRKVTKTKSSFTNDTSLEKMLYLASMNVIKKWTQRYRNWDLSL